MQASTAISNVFDFTGLVLPPREASAVESDDPSQVKVDTQALSITRIIHTENFRNQEGYRIADGDLFFRFAHEPSNSLLEVWMRRSGNNENLRVILEGSDGQAVSTRFWDLGPSLRRSLGGTIVPDGKWIEVPGIDKLATPGDQICRTPCPIKLDQHDNILDVAVQSGGISTFALEQVVESRFGRKAQPILLHLSIEKPQDGTPCTLKASATGWVAMYEAGEDPGRLFRALEEYRREVLWPK